MGIDMQTTWILLRGLVREQAHWEGFAERLASGVLLTYEGEGHTITFQGSSCVDGIAVREIKGFVAALKAAEPPLLTSFATLAI